MNIEQAARRRLCRQNKLRQSLWKRVPPSLLLLSPHAGVLQDWCHHHYANKPDKSDHTCEVCPQNLCGATARKWFACVQLVTIEPMFSIHLFSSDAWRALAEWLLFYVVFQFAYRQFVARIRWQASMKTPVKTYLEIWSRFWDKLIRYELQKKFDQTSVFGRGIWLGFVQWSDSIWTLWYHCSSSLRPHFTLTAFTVHTECLLDRCLSCHTDYSLCLTEAGFLCLLSLNSLCVTDSRMMQMHATCWGFVNYKISLNP